MALQTGQSVTLSGRSNVITTGAPEALADRDPEDVRTMLLLRQKQRARPEDGEAAGFHDN
jgi:hypothetical protein